MMDGGNPDDSHFGFAEGNPVPTYGGSGYASGGVNPENTVEEIDIPNDGGDW